MPDEIRKADALYIPASIIRGTDPFTRIEQVSALAKTLLSLADGETPRISPHETDQWGGFSYFVRKNLDDTKLFHKRHPRHPEIRHQWEDGENGIKLGYSKED